MIQIQQPIVKAPRLGNQFIEDQSLQHFLKFFLGNSQHVKIIDDLTNFGDKVSTDYVPHMKEAEINTPKLIQYSPFNERIDQLVLSEGWRFFKKQTAIEGLIAIPYENESQEFSRLHFAAKIYLFHPSSALFSCPIAMTDGCAYLVKNLLAEPQIKNSPETSKHLLEVYRRLTTRNPDQFWTSGQWMTERLGGSDVASGTQTVAVPVDSSKRLYALHGYKFFTSSTDSEVAMALARIVDQNDQKSWSKAPISLFLVFTKLDGKNNNVEIVRLKEKLGTRQLPTAELKLNGTLAYLVSEEGKGIKTITQLVNITRIHNAIAAVSSMRRIVNLAKDYATTREVFGKPLIDQPLQANVLNSLELSTQGNLLMILEAARLQGLIENKKASADEQTLLRVIIPLLKLFTGKEGVRVVSEGLECFGGQGYMEDSFIPQLLRDVQVTPIWEGTTNVQALDFLRAIEKERSGFKVLMAAINLPVQESDLCKETVAKQLSQIQTNLALIVKFLAENVSKANVIVWNARKIARNISLAFIASLCHKLVNTMHFQPNDVALREFWLNRCLFEWESLQVLPDNKLQEIKDRLISADFGKETDKRGLFRPKL